MFFSFASQLESHYAVRYRLSTVNGFKCHFHICPKRWSNGVFFVIIVSPFTRSVMTLLGWCDCLPSPWSGLGTHYGLLLMVSEFPQGKMTCNISKVQHFKCCVHCLVCVITNTEESPIGLRLKFMELSGQKWWKPCQFHVLWWPCN